MTGPSDFSDDELSWLVRCLKHGTTPPNEIRDKLVAAGVVDITDLGLWTTGLGEIVLDEARTSGRLPSHRHDEEGEEG